MMVTNMRPPSVNCVFTKRINSYDQNRTFAKNFREYLKNKHLIKMLLRGHYFSNCIFKGCKDFSCSKCKYAHCIFRDITAKNRSHIFFCQSAFILISKVVMAQNANRIQIIYESKKMNLVSHSTSRKHCS